MLFITASVNLFKICSDGALSAQILCFAMGLFALAFNSSRATLFEIQDSLCNRVFEPFAQLLVQKLQHPFAKTLREPKPDAG